MRIPITLKLFLCFSFIMLVSFGPAYWYVRHHLPDQHRGAVAADLGQQRRTLSFLHRSAGAAASLVLLLSLLARQYGVRRILHLRQATEAYARGDYTYPLPDGGRDEISDLGQSLAALARRVQQVMASQSADRAQRASLIRAIPLPVLLLSPELVREEINALFREAASIDPANEDVRIDALCSTPEFAAARHVALESGQPQSLRLQLPWLREALSCLLCSLPAASGRACWVLCIEQRRDEEHGDWRDPLVRSRQVGMRQIDALLGTLSRLGGDLAGPPAAALRARLVELRAAVDLLRRVDPPPPAAVTPTDLSHLLARVLLEVQPLADEGQVEVLAEVPSGPVLIADAHDWTGRVLRGLLVRAIAAARSVRDVGVEGHPVLSVLVQEEETGVQVHLSGPIASVQYADLDQLIGAIGGGIGPQPDPCATVLPSPAPGAGPVPAGPAAAGELWLQVRRA